MEKHCIFRSAQNVSNVSYPSVVSTHNRFVFSLSTVVTISGQHNNITIHTFFRNGTTIRLIGRRLDGVESGGMWLYLCLRRQGVYTRFLWSRVRFFDLVFSLFYWTPAFRLAKDTFEYAKCHRTRTIFTHSDRNGPKIIN